jgi:hypothetical protein
MAHLVEADEASGGIGTKSPSNVLATGSEVERVQPLGGCALFFLLNGP